MMRYLILIGFLTTSVVLNGQGLRPKSVSAAYIGETITHPGFKLGATYEIRSWQKTKLKKNGREKVILKSFDISPTLGFFYHADYQSALFILPELSYRKEKPSGRYVTYGVGAGYMRTFIPNVYDISSSNEIEKINAGYNYFVTNYSISFGKNLKVKHGIPLDVYIKPQLMYALPNYANGVMYFVLELGVSYKLDTK